MLLQRKMLHSRGFLGACAPWDGGPGPQTCPLSMASPLLLDPTARLRPLHAPGQRVSLGAAQAGTAGGRQPAVGNSADNPPFPPVAAR